MAVPFLRLAGSPVPSGSPLAPPAPLGHGRLARGSDCASPEGVRTCPCSQGHWRPGQSQSPAHHVLYSPGSLLVRAASPMTASSSEGGPAVGNPDCGGHKAPTEARGPSHTAHPPQFQGHAEEEGQRQPRYPRARKNSPIWSLFPPRKSRNFSQEVVLV